MSFNHLEILRGGYADFAKGNIPGVLAVLDPKIEWTEAEGFPYGGTYTGPTEVVEKVFMKLGTEWDGFKVAPREFLESGDRVIVLGQYSGTYKATGKSFRAEFAHVWTVRGGKAVKFVQYVDTALVQKALQP
ncbi:MAG: nuclear transport factor 2 family protein [Candidatus Zixiibacteriota bacterium]